ncbi:MAG TPA: MgtC/SapB family protein, partial [Thermoplasmata archaeon]|nr:MgtC/SapB family protein [Thermoplasmata archaeon]
MIDSTEAVLRLLLVFALAFAVGLERQVRRKPVGFGTFIFVSTGAATLTLLAITIEEENPLPLLGGVITGIGFLGAGALIRSNDRVFGFTTAALVWAMAALGVAAGAGLYLLVLVDYGIVW